MNITGFAIQFSLKLTVEDSDLITKTVGSGITLTDPTNGVLTVTIDDTDTTSLSPGNYVYSLKRTDAGNETTFAIGTITLIKAAQT